MNLFLILVFAVASLGFSPCDKGVFALNKDEKNVCFYYKDEKYSVDLEKYDVKSEIHTVIWQASKFSRRQSNKEKWKSILKFYEACGDVENSFEMVFPGIKNDVDKIEKKINSDGVNARLVLGKEFSVVKEKPGAVLDREKLYFKIFEVLGGEQQQGIALPTKAVEAKFKSEDLKDCKNLRASFKTNFSKSSPERKNNIQTAISKFNGLNIYPNETISFNNTTGIRNKKNGYKEAKIILNGEYVDGFGGGVCQASTTIYNACIRAGLDCKANCHSIPPSYVGKGLDAMVNSGSSDMKITNNSDGTIYLETYCTDSEVVVNVYGKALNGISFKPVVEVNEVLPDKGYKTIVDSKKEFADKVFYCDESFVKQKATNGFKTTTYLETYKNGKLLSKKKIRKDFYPASEGIVVYGSEKRPQPQENFSFAEFFM